MTLYSADISALAKPVEKKKGKKTQQLPTPTVSPEPVLEPVEPEVKPKKPRTEKQIAALEKAKEARKRKREEAEKEMEQQIKEIQEKEKEVVAKAIELAEKKRIRSEARKQKKLEKKQEQPVQESEPSEVEVPKPKKTKTVKKTNESDPPAWFAKYVEGVRQEEARISNEKKPKKEIKEEAKQKAASSWNDGLTRDRVAAEVDSHMNRLYSMIFSNRRMK